MHSDYASHLRQALDRIRAEIALIRFEAKQAQRNQRGEEHGDF